MKITRELLGLLVVFIVTSANTSAKCCKRSKIAVDRFLKLY